MPKPPDPPPITGTPDPTRYVQIALPVAGGMRGFRHIAVYACQQCGAIVHDTTRHATVNCR